MAELLFQNKFRIKSIRLPGWDYTAEGCYFITICAKNRENYFGKIVDNKMRLSAIGEIAKNEWYKSAQMRKNIILDEFVVMPNHVHGIIAICDKNRTDPVDCREIIQNFRFPINANHITGAAETPRRGVSTNGGKNILWKKNSIGSIVCQYKSAVAKKIHQIHYEFSWQPGYYDDIIKNENHLFNVREYIINNPAKWQFDSKNKLNKKNV